MEEKISQDVGTEDSGEWHSHKEATVNAVQGEDWGWGQDNKLCYKSDVLSLTHNLTPGLVSSFSTQSFSFMSKTRAAF